MVRLCTTILAPLAWIVTEVVNEKGFDLWSSDGNSVVGVPRGGPNLSYRLIVQEQGFLDITTIVVGHWNTTVVDFNGATLAMDGIHAASNNTLSEEVHPTVLPFILSLPGNGSFTATLDEAAVEKDTQARRTPCLLRIATVVSGSFKPFPEVTKDDVAFLKDMIAQKYVPYQNIPDAPGKTNEEIRKLGARLFPWSLYSYELAMAVYDWTTASFARMVFMKVFQYTGIPEAPFPLDSTSIASMIWESNWDTYTPFSGDFMNSFLMEPAKSLDDVEDQLSNVSSQLHQFSAVENRLLAAAAQSMPRICILAKPFLFSGQVDIYQMGLNRFGIEMLEFPGNAGPVGQALEVQFANAIASFIKPGSIITTKMVWSFMDTIADAVHYSNGILLIAEPPPELESLVWDATTYITELSDDATKTEYLFPPGKRFLVKSVEQATIQDIPLQVIRLQVQPERKIEDPVEQVAPTAPMANRTIGRDAALMQAIKVGIPSLDQIPIGDGPKINHAEAGKTNGRKCRCVKD